MSLKKFTLQTNNSRLTTNDWLRAELQRFQDTINENLMNQGGSRTIWTSIESPKITLRNNCLYQSLFISPTIQGNVFSIEYSNPLSGAIFCLYFRGYGSISYKDISFPLESDSRGNSDANSSLSKAEFLFYEAEKGNFKWQKL